MAEQKKKGAGRRGARRGIVEEPRLSAVEAIREAMRCLQCFDAPCTEACAASIPVPRFIRMIRTGNVSGAAEVVRAAHPFCSVCGAICPDENLCQAACTRGRVDFPVRIRRLHAFATEHDAARGGRVPAMRPGAKGRAAVVGGGPAGLACAARLAQGGVAVDLFEMNRDLGGILADQIPPFRLPAAVLKRDIRAAVGRGVRVRTGAEVTDIDDLARRYDGVFVGAGAHGEASAGLPGEKLPGVMTSAAFLRALKGGRMKSPGAVVVVGGGNVALDCSLAALHAGARRVGLYYRRSFNQMPAWKRELDMAVRAGVELQMLCIPRAFAGRRGKLAGVTFCRAELGKPGKDGRRVPVRIAGSEFTVPCDTAVVATGQRVDDALLRQVMGGAAAIAFKVGILKVRKNIYVGGDLAGRGTIVEAVGDGKAAAAAILEACRRMRGEP